MVFSDYVSNEIRLLSVLADSLLMPSLRSTTDTRRSAFLNDITAAINRSSIASVDAFNNPYKVRDVAKKRF